MYKSSEILFLILSESPGQAEPWLGYPDLSVLLLSPEPAGSDEDLTVHSLDGLMEMGCRLLSPHCRAFGPQKSDCKNVYLASQSGFPEESFGQNNPHPGLGHLKSGEMGEREPRIYRSESWLERCGRFEAPDRWLLSKCLPPWCHEVVNGPPAHPPPFSLSLSLPSSSDFP